MTDKDRQNIITENYISPDEKFKNLPSKIRAQLPEKIQKLFDNPIKNVINRHGMNIIVIGNGKFKLCIFYCEKDLEYFGFLITDNYDKFGYNGFTFSMILSDYETFKINQSNKAFEYYINKNKNLK